MQNTLDEIKELIFSTVIKDAKKIPPVNDDHKSIWDTLGHMANFDYFIESNLVDDYFRARIELQFDKFPAPVQALMWLETEQGQTSMFNSIHHYKGEETLTQDLEGNSNEETVEHLYSLLKVKADEEFSELYDD